MLLTEANLNRLNKARSRADSDKSSRVFAYTVGGVQCCLAGVGEGDDLLTFPMNYLVESALVSPHWVRFATEAERSDDSTRWWRPLEFQPTAVIFASGAIAAPEDAIGLEGLSVTVVQHGRKRKLEEIES